VTKLIPHNYNPKAECPTWLEHLDAVFQGDKALIAYFQRCVGYSLTALTVEQCGFFLVGTGANGKSTTVDALRYAFGEYALATDPVILLAGKGGANSKADALKADLVGIRFASLSENDAGTRLNQADFKKMMSGDQITAKRLYVNPVTFNPVFTMWFDVNHLPTFDGTDDAMVRRIKVIPFNAKFKRGEKGTDGRRAEKLRAEAEGILAWAVRGAMDWFAHGGTQGSIGTCAAVERATEEYATENDPLASFIHWNYDTSDPNAFIPVIEFQTALENHLQHERLPQPSKPELNKRLAEMGISRKTVRVSYGTQRVYMGIKRRPDDGTDPAF
jgi:putative DNA primase/helicase